MSTLIKRKDIMEYEDAPSGAIKLYNYKEPFMENPNGHGFLGVLMHDAERDLIQCHVCGEWFYKLAWHIKKHGFQGVSDYKTEFGLSQSTALISEGLRELYIKNGKVNGALNKVSLDKGRKIAHELRKQKETSGIPVGYKYSLEVKNNRGTCPLQLLDKLDKIEKELGYRPTHKQLWFLKSLEGKYFSGRGFIRSLEFTYGSWENAMAQMNWTGLDRKKHRKWTKESLKNLLKEFLFQHNRFPYPSDSKRKIFPDIGTFKPYGGIRKMKDEILLELIKNYK